MTFKERLKGFAGQVHRVAADELRGSPKVFWVAASVLVLGWAIFILRVL